MNSKYRKAFPPQLLYVFVLINFNIFAQTSTLGLEVNKLSKYIASNKFKELKLKMHDNERTDTLFEKALEITNGNYREALFALTFTVIPYNYVPIKIPLINVVFNYPLISACENVFDLKNKNLPKYLFFSSPTDNFGDKDKLAHFFGSAFLSYSNNIFDLTELIGYFVEVFEQYFKVQSSIDPRDIHADTLGDLFGRLLKENKKVFPSQLMMMKTLFYCRFNIP